MVLWFVLHVCRYKTFNHFRIRRPPSDKINHHLLAKSDFIFPWNGESNRKRRYQTNQMRIVHNCGELSQTISMVGCLFTSNRNSKQHSIVVCTFVAHPQDNDSELQQKNSFLLQLKQTCKTGCKMSWVAGVVTHSMSNEAAETALSADSMLAHRLPTNLPTPFH